jgi:hypothetical protein
LTQWVEKEEFLFENLRQFEEYKATLLIAGPLALITPGETKKSSLPPRTPRQTPRTEEEKGFLCSAGLTAEQRRLTPHLLEHTVSFPFYRATNMAIKELMSEKKSNQDVLK